MPKKKITSLEKKEKLVKQLKKIKSRLIAFDKKRAEKIGSLAKIHRLTELSDDIIKNEFKLLAEKHKATIENSPSKKKS